MSPTNRKTKLKTPKRCLYSPSKVKKALDAIHKGIFYCSKN